MNTRKHAPQPTCAGHRGRRSAARSRSAHSRLPKAPPFPKLSVPPERTHPLGRPTCSSNSAWVRSLATSFGMAAPSGACSGDMRVDVVLVLRPGLPESSEVPRELLWAREPRMAGTGGDVERFAFFGTRARGGEFDSTMLKRGPLHARLRLLRKQIYDVSWGGGRVVRDENCSNCSVSIRSGPVDRTEIS